MQNSEMELCGLLQPNYWGARIMDRTPSKILGARAPRIDVPAGMGKW